MHNRLKALREQKNLTQRKIAEYLEIYQQQYALYEQGKTRIPIEIIIKLCKLYNISADYILGLIEEPRKIKKDTKIVQNDENGTETSHICRR